MADDSDPRWVDIISETDNKLCKRIYEEASGILPLVLLEEDLQNVVASPDGFWHMIRSQTLHLLQKKGPRSGKDHKNEQENHTNGTTAPEEERSKRRYKAKTVAERKVLASMFHLLWPPLTYGRNSVTCDAKPSLKKKKHLTIEERFASLRLRWQLKVVQERVVLQTLRMKGICTTVPTFFKPLPVLFFTLSRFFVACHFEESLRPEHETAGTNREGTTALVKKLAGAIEGFRKIIQKTHSTARIEYKDAFVDDSFEALLRMSECMLVDMANLASPETVYDDERYLTSLGSITCAGGVVECRKESETCFLDSSGLQRSVKHTKDEEFEMSRSHGGQTRGVEGRVSFARSRGGDGRSCGEALTFAAFFIDTTYRFYEAKIRSCSTMEEDVLSRLRLRIRESCIAAHGFSVYSRHSGSNSEGKSITGVDSEKVKRAQAQILIFWRTIFTSVKDIVEKTATFAEENGIDVKGCLLEEIVAVSALSNTLLRPQSAAELITKIKEMELSLFDSRYAHKKAAPKQNNARSSQSDSKKSKIHPSVVTRPGFEEDLDSEDSCEGENTKRVINFSEVSRGGETRNNENGEQKGEEDKTEGEAQQDSQRNNKEAEKVSVTPSQIRDTKDTDKNEASSTDAPRKRESPAKYLLRRRLSRMLRRSTQRERRQMAKRDGSPRGRLGCWLQRSRAVLQKKLEK